MPRAKTETKNTKEKATAKKAVVVKPKSLSRGLTVEVYSSAGRALEKMVLPKEIFGAKVNEDLMAQAVRVYLANQRQGTVSTKTRGEVEGSTRKIYRQKGTGRARHGSLRAPIFVHGGLVFGPKPRDYSMKFPKKMKKAALFSALTGKYQAGEVKVFSGLTKIEPKTKTVATLLKTVLKNEEKRKSLLVLDSSKDSLSVLKASRNIKGVTVAPVKNLNTYEILRNKNILFMKEAVDVLAKHYLGGEK